MVIEAECQYRILNPFFLRYSLLLCMLHHCLSPIIQPNVIWMLGAHAFYKTITIFSSSLHAEHIVA